LHYSGFYDSANGQATIIDNANGQPFQANEFLPSSMDIYQICMAYGCNKCAGLDIDYYDGQGRVLKPRSNPTRLSFELS